MGKIIDGKAIAQTIRDEVKEEIIKLKDKHKIAPKLVVVLVGDDPGSQVYVRNKEKAAADAGMIGESLRFSASISQKELENSIKKLNQDPSVHGILLQLPLPKGLDEKRALELISPLKDVDGLHIENMGRLLKGERPFFLPCTPSGIIHLILSTGLEIKGKKAVVIGRSNIVGKPVALMLLEQHATVTICHSRTIDLDKEVGAADILVAAIGKTKMIKGAWIKQGAVVIDVGMNHDENGKLCGDVDFATAKDRSSYITPVPGGVGPMTIAMLMRNTLLAAARVASIRPA